MATPFEGSSGWISKMNYLLHMSSASFQVMTLNFLIVEQCKSCQKTYMLACITQKKITKGPKKSHKVSGDLVSET